MADLFDIIELTIDIPKNELRAGQRGTIVEKHAEDAYEVEFANETGETLALICLEPDQFITIWRAQACTWVPVVEQVAALVTSLPEDSRREVLDFARFLYERSKIRQDVVV